MKYNWTKIEKTKTQHIHWEQNINKIIFLAKNLRMVQ
jgi:hypothetical protein